jgi:hypothetical protein|tara:strand:- start:538 stop:915 length:378 start_codon:yes stop_codon:yes gene_type:complete
MRNYVIILVIIVAVGYNLLNNGEDENAQSVKFAKLGSCPQMTLEEMAEGFMGSHSWSSGEGEDGNSFVNLEGDITYRDKEVTALIQFQLNNDETFEFRAIELNEIPQPTIMGLTLLEKMCEGSKK